MELGGFALAVSAASLYLSYRTYEDNKKTKKLETRPIFYIDSTFENRDERYIEFNISALKSKDIRSVDLIWIGNNNAKLRFNKILKNEETNTWEYKAILDLKNTILEKEVNGKLIIECNTVYEECITYYKEIKIISKYNPLVEKYVQELIMVASTEFSED